MMAPPLLSSVLRGNSFIPFSAAILLLADVCLGVEITQTPSEVLKKPGDEVQLVCSHGKTDYTYMQWYQKPPGDPALKRIGHLNYGDPELETAFKNRFRISGDLSGEKAKNASVFIQRLQVEDSGVFYCAASRDANYEAYFGAGTKLTVLDPDKEIKPPTVQVFKPSENERKNEQKTLVCVASGFYPDHVSVSWKIDDDVVDVTLDHTKAVATDDAARLDNKTYTITSQLIVSSDVWFSNSEFICNVSFFNGTHTVFRDGNTTGGGIRTDLTRDKYLWITQSAKLSYIIFIAKSCVYGAFIWFVAWKLQRSAAKKSKK